MYVITSILHGGSVTIVKIMELSLPGPMCFESNVPMNWEKFKQKFMLYLEASEKISKPDKQKVALLLHCMGDQGIDVYNTFTYTENECKDNLQNVLSKFDTYCKPRKNIVYDRFKFFSRSQMNHESVDKYVTELKILAVPCEFGNELENLIRDRLVLGIQDKGLQERLLREPELELKKALDTCRANEASKQQIEEIKGGMVVNEVKKEKKKEQAGMGKSESSNSSKCTRCGFTHRFRYCPAAGKICRKCNKSDHFASQCKTKTEKYVTKTIEKKADSEEEDEAVVLTVNRNINIVRWKQNAQVSGQNIAFKIDTGSDVNLISNKIYNKFSNKPKLNKTKIHLSSYSNHKIPISGGCNLDCKINGKTVNLMFLVTTDELEPILGLDAAVKYGLVNNVNAINDCNSEAKNIINGHAKLFQEGGLIKCTPYHITLDENAIPKIHSARKVPLAIKPKLKQEIDDLVKRGVLEKIDEPTDWVHPIVTVIKPNGNLRVCMDPRDLNKYLKREHYALPTIESTLSELHGSQYFTVLDAATAFLQVPLDSHSSKICTIATPFGRFRYKTMPYGISSAPEVYQKIINQIFEGLDGVVPYMDDVLIYGRSQEEHNKRLEIALSRAKKFNLHFSKTKLQLSQQKIKFLGHIVSNEGIQIEHSKIAAIQTMKTPTNKQEVQRFLGMITFLAKFLPNLSQKTILLRNLLNKKNEFKWEKEEENDFQELKKMVCEAPILKFYDPNKSLCISVDASSHGLGGVALQEGRPVGYVSVALNETQRKYAQIEKELLAVQYGLQKFHLYTYGRKVLIQTDHKPLLSIINKPMEKITPRMQRMILKLMRYDFALKYVSGKELYVADALSRAPNHDNSYDTSYLDGNKAIVHSLVCATPSRIQELKKATQQDEAIQKVVTYLNKGWPPYKKDIKDGTNKYWEVKDELTYADELLFYGNRIVIPESERQNVIKKLHSSHQGVSSCQYKAKPVLFWPSMMKDIEEFILRCTICQQYSKANKEQPLKPHKISELPWNKIGLDFAKIKNKDYLMIVDYFSKFVIVNEMTSKTAKAVIEALEKIIPILGIPMEVMSDNGPPFNSIEYKIFLSKYDINANTSSPYYPKSNGLAERHIQTIKGLLTKAGDSKEKLMTAVLDYNSTPKNNLPSPAELLMGRRIRTDLLMTRAMLTPRYDTSNAIEELERRQTKSKEYHDKNTKYLPDLLPNQDILIQMDTRNWTPARVIEKSDQPESYQVQTPDGKCYRRNRLHLKPLLRPDTPTTPSAINESEVRVNNSEIPTSESDKPPNIDTGRPKRQAALPKYLSDYDLSE